MTIPGIIGHWNCRKLWIHDAWQRAHREGFDTLIVLGSGFDTLSMRVARETGSIARTIDIDHPATLAVRRAGIEKTDGPTPRFIKHDLTRSGLPDALGKEIPRGASVFLVIEGVLMYLDPLRVDQLLEEIGSICGRRLRLALTFMELTTDGQAAFRPRSRLIDTWLAFVGEPFRSGMSVEAMGDLLARHGFRTLEATKTPGHGLVDLPLCEGESAIIADHLRGNR